MSFNLYRINRVDLNQISENSYKNNLFNSLYVNELNLIIKNYLTNYFKIKNNLIDYNFQAVGSEERLTYEDLNYTNELTNFINYDYKLRQEAFRLGPEDEAEYFIENDYDEIEDLSNITANYKTIGKKKSGFTRF